MLDVLAGHRILQIESHQRDAVDAEHDDEGLLGIGRVAELAGNADAVGSIPSVEVWVEAVRCLEDRKVNLSTVALGPRPLGRQRAVGVHPLTEVFEHLLAGPRAVQAFELRPSAGLGLLDEGEHHIGKDGALPIVAVGGNGDVASAEEVLFDDRLERSLGVARGHASSPSCCRRAR